MLDGEGKGSDKIGDRSLLLDDPIHGDDRRDEQEGGQRHYLFLCQCLLGTSLVPPQLKII